MNSYGGYFRIGHKIYQHMTRSGKRDIELCAMASDVHEAQFLVEAANALLAKRKRAAS